MRLRPFTLGLVAGLLLLAVGTVFAGTPAGLSIRLDPNLVGRSSTLEIVANPQSGQGDGRVPKSAVLSIQRGFKLDPRARAARCSSRQAENFNCPRASRIGGGEALVTASGAIVPGGSQDFTAAIDLFLAPPIRPNDLAGIVVYVHEPTTGQRGTTTARLVRRARGPYGYELRFEFGDGQAAPPGVTIELKHLELRAGAKRTVTRAGRRVTFSLITNPAACDGTWNGQGVIRFTDGSSEQADLSSPCRRR